MINVRPRPGTEITIDEDALSPTPNCQTTRSPLYDCTNHPRPCGRRKPSASTGGVHATASVSGLTSTPLRSAASKRAMFWTVDTRPPAGVSPVAVYVDGVERPFESTAYGFARLFSTAV